MKKMILIGLICVMSALIYSCDSNGLSSSKFSSFNGVWRITIDEMYHDYDIEVGTDYMIFDDTKYIGTGTETFFKGTYLVINGTNRTQRDLTIIKDGNTVSGDIRNFTTSKSGTYLMTDKFTGYRLR